MQAKAFFFFLFERIRKQKGLLWGRVFEHRTFAYFWILVILDCFACSPACTEGPLECPKTLNFLSPTIKTKKTKKKQKNQKHTNGQKNTKCFRTSLKNSDKCEDDWFCWFLWFVWFLRLLPQVTRPHNLTLWFLFWI